MQPESSNQRLSRISTLWTLVHEAHDGTAETVGTAQRVLMQRYCGAVYHYLLGAVRDEDVAAELFQEFALRFLRGDFRRADPARGRFRDYVKKAVSNLVNEHHRARRKWPQPLPSNVAGPPPTPPEQEADAGFIEAWKQELMNRTWEALAQAQPTFHAVLLFHYQHPDLSSVQAAELLSAQLGEAFTANRVRVTLHRAREKFAYLLLAEVERSLETPSEAELVQELRNLNLWKLCRAALACRGIG
jgi:RNA polymerase sigma-70 factor (ECF subfamily)